MWKTTFPQLLGAAESLPTRDLGCVHLTRIVMHFINQDANRFRIRMLIDAVTEVKDVAAIANLAEGGDIVPICEGEDSQLTAQIIVPIVSGAVIFDLNHREYHTPTAETGFEACENASRTPAFGQNGVGRGATAGKIRGLRYASKTGVGACTVKTAGVTLTAVVAVNALGDVLDPETGKIVAGAKANDGSFIDTEKHIVSGGLLKLFAGANTTVGCILTDARIDKVQANKLASAGHGGLSRAIRPVHTDFDGDTLFCLASGKKPVLNLLLLQTAAAYAVERAVVAAATEGAAYDVSYDESEEDGEE